MISHHPKLELLQAFVQGELPASLSAGIAIHADMCPECQHKIAQLTEQYAESDFEESFLHKFAIDEQQDMDTIADIDFDSMIESITDDISTFTATDTSEKNIEFKGEQFVLPKQLHNMDIASPFNVGKLARSKVSLDEGEIHTNLLHIEPGGSVPHHTHKGFELTVLLAGTFSDESGDYVPGDFIMLDGKHKHQPFSEEGCLCYTVANDSLHFTQGLSQLLNPIGSFIY